jgi:hypothetical protein
MYVLAQSRVLRLTLNQSKSHCFSLYGFSSQISARQRQTMKPISHTVRYLLSFLCYYPLCLRTGKSFLAPSMVIRSPFLLFVNIDPLYVLITIIWTHP